MDQSENSTSPNEWAEELRLTIGLTDSEPSRVSFPHNSVHKCARCRRLRHDVKCGVSGLHIWDERMIGGHPGRCGIQGENYDPIHPLIKDS